MTTSIHLMDAAYHEPQCATGINLHGMALSLSMLEPLMDAELKTRIREQFPHCSAQDLLDTYLIAHEDKFGRGFLQV